MNEEIKGKVRIAFEGKFVSDVYLVVLQISNDGNVSIMASDFERPLSIAFGETSKILSAEVTNVTPKTLKPFLDIDTNRIILQPLLLNSKDSITIKLLLTQYKGRIETDARIVGVREVRKAGETSLRSRLPLIYGSYAIAAMTSFSVIFFLGLRYEVLADDLIQFLFAYYLPIVGGVGLILVAVRIIAETMDMIILIKKALGKFNRKR